MADITDCSPEEALWKYHNDAMAVLEQQFQNQITAMAPQLDAVAAAVADINATVEEAFGPEPESACTLPSAPTKDDVEAMVSTPSMSVVNGRIILPGTLSLAALRRLHGIFGNMGAIARYVPEFSIAPIDPDFGNTGLASRLIVIELRIETTESIPNACATDDVLVTEREVLVSVNSKVSEPSDDRILVCVWIGKPELTDGIRSRMVDLGLDDEEIVSVALSQPTPGLEIYDIENPWRLWQFTKSISPDGEDRDIPDNIATLLARPIDSVNDNPSSADTGRALRDALTTPAVSGCGFPIALGLLGTLDMATVFPQTDAECDSDPNIFGPVNEIFGAMGSIQRTINRVMTSYQNTIGQSMAVLVSTVTTVERNYLGRGLVSASVTGPSGTYGAAANYMGSTRTRYAAPGSQAATLTGPTHRFNATPTKVANTPSLPQVPELPQVNLDQVQRIVQKLNSYMTLITDSVNAVTQIVTGMSLLMCSVSAVGNVMDRYQPNIGFTDQPFAFARPKCADDTLVANLDMSSINFDLCNVAISMLRDIIHRLITLINSLTRAQLSSNSLVQMNCSVTETTQLATDIARRLAAQNWGKF